MKPGEYTLAFNFEESVNFYFNLLFSMDYMIK